MLAITLLYVSAIAVVNAARTIRVRNETGVRVTVTAYYGAAHKLKNKEDIGPGNDFEFPRGAYLIDVVGRTLDGRRLMCGVSGIPPRDTYIIAITAHNESCSIQPR